MNVHSYLCKFKAKNCISSQAKGYHVKRNYEKKEHKRSNKLDLCPFDLYE